MRQPKILYIDIETSLNEVYSFVIGKKIFLHPANIKVERKIICIAWKWGHEKSVHVVKWQKKDKVNLSDPFTDKQLLIQITAVINKADLIIAHNGDKYDIRFINGRLFYHQLPAMYHAKSDDTLKQSRKTFYLNSNTLDYLGAYTKLGRKRKTDIDLWIKTGEGNAKALAYMIQYCKEDVRLCEKIHKRMQPYVQSSINMSLAQGGPKNGCKACGASREFLKPKGFRFNPRSTKHKYVCSICGKWDSF